jgi:membrane protease YdiL (CAAX protease family)
MAEIMITAPDLGSVFFSGVVSFFILWISWRRGLFRLCSILFPVPIRFSNLIGAFAIYFLVSFAASALFTSLLKSRLLSNYLSASSWFNFVSSGLVLLLLITYLRTLPAKVREGIIQPGEITHPFRVNLAYGFLAWVVSFPLVLFISNLLEYITYHLFKVTQLPDQLAVQFLKMTFKNPLYFTLATFSIVLFAPILEELLFRGFLQTFIRQHLGSRSAIFITSLCFAFFHFSPEQGLGNLPIIASLFALALFLGFLYEKQGSLLAPIALHASFNAISVLNLYFLGGITGGF